MAKFDDSIRKKLSYCNFNERASGEFYKIMPIEWTITPKKDDDRYCVATITAHYEFSDLSVSTTMSTGTLDLLLRKDENIDRMLFDWFKKLLDKIYGMPR